MDWPSRPSRVALAFIKSLTSSREDVRRFGSLKGRLTVDESFFEPLAESELEAWEG